MEPNRETKWFHFPKCRVCLFRNKAPRIWVKHIPASWPPFPHFFSSFLKDITISQWDLHFSRGNTQKESLSSHIIILLFENMGQDILLSEVWDSKFKSGYSMKSFNFSVQTRSPSSRQDGSIYPKGTTHILWSRDGISRNLPQGHSIDEVYVQMCLLNTQMCS